MWTSWISAYFTWRLRIALKNVNIDNFHKIEVSVEVCVFVCLFHISLWFTFAVYIEKQHSMKLEPFEFVVQK
jgi:hypothetical protein